MIGRLELEREAGGEVERGDRGLAALRIRERERDRHAHVRISEVRERCAVAEADERVHDRRRMHDDLDPLVREPEEVVRLDQLEALVRERGRVDGDLRPHRPRRMRECLLHGHCFELGVRSVSERAPGRREDDRLDRVAAPPLETLEHRRVLAVHRKQEAPSPLPGRDGEVAGGDEALLVRECQRHTALERPQRRTDTGEPDDRVQHEIGVGRLEHLGEVAADLDVLDAVLRCEVVERLRARRERADHELGMRADDLERLATDRPGRTEQGNSSLAHDRRLTGVVQARLCLAEGENQEVRGRPGPEQRVEAIEHPTMSGKHAP